MRFFLEVRTFMRIIVRMANFTPSPYQAAIFDKIENTRESLIIEAVAGSGKTTTIVQGVELMPPSASILFLAFNKDIANELGERLPWRCITKTFHAICLGAWLRYCGGSKDLTEFIDGDKMRRIVKKGLKLTDIEIELYIGFVLKLVGFAKNAGVGFLVEDKPAEWLKLVDHFDLQLDSEDATIKRGVEIARAALHMSIKYADRVIDYDDMLFMPLLCKCNFFRNDFVLVDESQDTNAVQRALLKRMLKSDGRLIAVGDSAQAIYGFRGADSDAMEIIAREFGCVKMPLTVSYRCPKAVVKKAQEVVPHIEAFEGASDGEVIELAGYTEHDFTPGDAVICRNVAPLVSMAYGLLTRNVGCKVLGRDIGEGLVKLIERLKAKGIDRLLEKLEEWRAREVERARAKENEAKIESINDTTECVRAFVGMLDENNRTVPALVRKIESLFGDGEDEDLITLCSAHKSKGLEWRTVYLLDADELMPSKWARKAWQQEQEQNLIYVAYTRAKRSLRFINSGAWVKADAPEKVAA
jgi:superfamily I DNA/RNA helicase